MFRMMPPQTVQNLSKIGPVLAKIEHFQIWQFVVLTVNPMLISYTQNLKMHPSHALNPSQDKNPKKKVGLSPWS